MANTLIVAISVSLVCSIVVAVTATLLAPRQAANELRFRAKTVLEVAGLYRPGDDIEQRFASIDVRYVDLATGDYVGSEDAVDVTIPEHLDVAGLRQRPSVAPVYLVRDGADVSQIIVPVEGPGLWSTMYGYLAVAPDGNTVRGLRFYQHGETPGIGDQIDDERWLQQWSGKRLFDDRNAIRIEVARGRVEDDPHRVDGMSGATLTGRGVTKLVQYWVGPHAFGPYLERIRNGESEHG